MSYRRIIRILSGKSRSTISPSTSAISPSMPFPNRFAAEGRFPLMARTALVTIHIIRSLDSGCASFYGNLFFSMAEFASELCPMKTVVEFHGSSPAFSEQPLSTDCRIYTVRSHFYSGLGSRHTGKDKND
jgi:hypothetical protein